MFFSIVIPVYNAEKYLNNCIQSILCQSYADYELILVDDGSRDSSPRSIARPRILVAMPCSIISGNNVST